MTTSLNNLVLYTSIAIAASVAMAQSVSFDTNFVELDASKMIHTGDRNHAISSNNLPSNWRCVSLNNDEVKIVTKENPRVITTTYDSLTPTERQSLTNIKSTLTSVITSGPFSFNQASYAKLTTFDRNGGSSSSSNSGGGSSSSSASSSSSGGTSIQKTGPNEFIVSKQNFPYGWHRVFFNNDLVTVVYKSARVLMLPENLMDAPERSLAEQLRRESGQSNPAQQMQQQMASSLRNPMEFVSNFMNGMFG